MTRQELEEDVNVGDIVKITTKSGEFTGRVEEFGESAIRLTNPENGKPKRIAYEFIMEYEINAVSTTDAMSIGIDTKSKMVTIPGTKYRIGMTPVTQRLYNKVMGENPSWFQLSNDRLNDDRHEALAENGNSSNNPVENVSWFDAVYFCNKLSMMEGLTPAYSVDGETDPKYWGYMPHNYETINSDVDCDFNTNGYRLPTNDEWEKAANGGDNYTYSGSNDLDEVGWYGDNSNNVTHSVAQKMENSYGLYDISGNVCEWVWNTCLGRVNRYICGGSWSDCADRCEVTYSRNANAGSQLNHIGFRLLRPLD
ncbi:MAG: SUMF1/EgtB/PvdO family nonheme iron enzyme [Treponema sp.]|nr:SUMF1/EgtB/PvdO family nonheme iron enzyme [Treponema sp.]